MGGYIGASQTQNEGDIPIASVTYRIPVARWEDALDLLGGLNGLTTKVVSQQTTPSRSRARSSTSRPGSRT